MPQGRGPQSAHLRFDLGDGGALGIRDSDRRTATDLTVVVVDEVEVVSGDVVVL